jgi:methyl-accepting chemotaxis protein
VAEKKLQADSATMIEALRYGPKNEDYFWINDMEPTMVMHPYKPELNGTDLSGNADPNGKRLFVEFVKTCQENGEGFVDYYWPKYGADKPQPKLSFVKLFEPWNWIIGTGLYIDDIEALVADKERELVVNMEKASQDIVAKVRQVQEETIGARTRVLQFIVGGTCLLVLLVLSVSLLLARRNITLPIRSISETLGENNMGISSTAQEISALSQELAHAASSQAASLEETSSSMEELSAMTRQNAENAQQADNLMRSAIDVVKKAEQSMAELKGSMDEISDSGEQSSKIIKTIDEIAFQTNLLALNAAVEAARAGDAGAGFAVVADEVRNLAVSAAEAARNTSELIEGGVHKTAKGSDLLAQTDGAFSEVARSAVKVAELLAEISIGSSEQAEGIEQINRAIAEMDKITQQNAATAENSAGSAVELQAETTMMKRAVEELIQLISGARTRSESRLLDEKHLRKANPDDDNKLQAKKKPEYTRLKDRKVTPEQIIPLEDDFKDF